MLMAQATAPNGRDMAQIGAATATQHVQPRQHVQQLVIILRQFGHIAIVEFGGFVQLGMAAARGIGAERPDPINPITA